MGVLRQRHLAARHPLLEISKALSRLGEQMLAGDQGPDGSLVPV